MSPVDWTVAASGAAAIVLINWYFFAEPPVASAVALAFSATAPRTEDVISATIVVDGGYAPAALEVPAGHPLRLVFERRDTSSCSEEVVLPAFGIRRFLPTGSRTVVDLPVLAPGVHEFTCGMGMLRGKLFAR